MLARMKFRAAVPVLILAAVFLLSGCEGLYSPEQEPGEETETAEVQEESVDREEASEFSGRLEDGVRTVELEAFQFDFEPDEIVVREGETVRLKATSTDVTHGFGLEGYGVEQELPPGKQKLIEFTADEPGEFHFHCTVYCGPGHSDMHGELVVKEADSE